MDEELQSKILNYFFGELKNYDCKPMEGVIKRWYAHNPTQDQEIKTLFGDTIEKALKGGLDQWQETPKGKKKENFGKNKIK